MVTVFTLGHSSTCETIDKINEGKTALTKEY